MRAWIAVAAWAVCDYTNCDACYSSSLCHWCGTSSSGTCHMKGAGCMIGAPCANSSSCAAAPDCSSCRARGSSCHWCSDNRCHVVGSLYGCVEGTYCYTDDKCKRPQPVFVGYGGAPVMVIGVAIVLVVGSALATACCVGACWSVHREVAALDSEAVVLGEAPFQNMDNAERRVEQRLPTSGLRRAVGRVFYALLAGCVIGWLMFTGLVSTTAYLWPIPPSVGLCNTQVDWSTILRDLASIPEGGSVQADYEILLSLYNPNRLSVNVTGLTGDFRYGTAKVATLQFQPASVPAGHVTDALAVMALSTDKWKAMGLVYDYEKKGKLILDMDLAASFEVQYGALSLPLSYSLAGEEVNVNEPSDRSYCHCPAEGVYW